MTAAEELAQRLLDRFGYLVVNFYDELPVGHVFHRLEPAESGFARENVIDATFVITGTAALEDLDEQLAYLADLRGEAWPPALNYADFCGRKPYFYKAVAE